MTLSKADRDFWKSEIKSELQMRIAAIQAEAGKEIVEEAKAVAFNEALDDYGLASDYLELESEIEQLEKLREQKEQQENVVKDKTDSINARLRLIQGSYQINTSHYYGYRNTSWRTDFQRIAESRVPEVLARSFGKHGEQISQIILAMPRIDRAIMFATSPRQLKSFLESVAEKYGISLGEDAL